MPQTILITGMTGLIGGEVRSRLEGRYQLRALNRRAVPGVDCHQADIGDLEAIAPAFAGVDVVVHLAALIGDSWDALLDANIVGTYNVFEAARRSDVQRVVFASSGSVVAGYEQVSPYRELATGKYEEAPPTWPKMTADTPVWPAGLYACSKVWGEALARHYCDAHGLSILCLRFGRVNPENRPTQPREYCVWLSHRDVAQMIERCIEAPDHLGYEVFFVVSDNKWGYRDLTSPHRAVGFEPQDSADDYR